MHCIEKLAPASKKCGGERMLLHLLNAGSALGSSLGCAVPRLGVVQGILLMCVLL